MSAWPQIFRDPRENLYQDIENIPHIERQAALGKDGDLISVFMLGPEESDCVQPRADRIQQLCPPSRPLQPVALLDERGWEDGKLRPRTPNRPLTADELYGELKKPRFQPGQSSRSPVSGSSPEKRPYRAFPRFGIRLYGAAHRGKSKAQTAHHVACTDDFAPDTMGLPLHEPNADRRLVFITDLDLPSIYALASTASEHQAPVLRTAIDKHLAFETFIGAKISTISVPTFELAFHVTYFAWRASTEVLEDPRRDMSGNRLRDSHDVSFLTRTTDQQVAHLHEAQISFVVAGHDEWRWTAYCFVDTYFDTRETGKEDVLSYYNDSQGEQGMNADPITFGVHNADDPIPNPREYYLEVIRIRINQINQEWTRIVMKVQASFRAYEREQGKRPMPSGSSLQHRTRQPKVKNEWPEKSSEWLFKYKTLLTKLLSGLSTTVEALGKFLSNTDIFDGLSTTAHKHPSLSGVNANFADLQALENVVRKLKERCDEIPQELQLQLDVHAASLRNQQLQFYDEAAKLSKQQHQLTVDAARQADKVARLTEQFSWTTLIFVSPIALAANLFSLDSKVVPFAKQNFASFATFVLALAGLGIVFLTIVSCWPKAIDSVQKYYFELGDTISRLPRRARYVSGDEEEA